MRVIQERNASNVPQVTYTRGLDLSGGWQGAGGIGGLLVRTAHSGSDGVTYYRAFYHADGGGNITCLINENNLAGASYRYDPFGSTIGTPTGLAAANAYRFSSKEWCGTSGLYYYGYRFYDPAVQQWLNRDPIGEAGGINLYGFVGNSPLRSVDLFGLLVTAVLDPGANSLIVTDNDTEESITAETSTGGHANPDCLIVSPGTGKEIPAPAGSYSIVDNPNPTPGMRIGLVYS